MIPHPAVRFLLRQGRCLALLVALLAGGSLLRADDDAIIAEMRRKIIEIQKQMVGEADAAKLLGLQGQVRAVMDETMPKLTPPTRALFEVSLKVIMPIQDLTTAYMQQVGAYTGSPRSDFATIRTVADIDERIALVEGLVKQNEAVLDRLNNFDKDCEKVLATSSIAAEAKRGFLVGVSEGFGRQIGPMRAIRNLDTQAYRQLQKAYGYLKEHWGKWKPGTNGGLAWDDAGQQAEFVAICTEISGIVERQTKAQQVLVERMQQRK